MPHPADGYIGARIAHHRNERGLTQQGLAMRAHVSKSLIAQVETGKKPATATLISACARALTIDPAVLTGRHHRDLRDDEYLHALLGPVRCSLDLYDLPPDEEVRPRPLRALRTAVRKANKIAQSAEYTALAERLPALLSELHTAAHTWPSPDREAAWGLLAEAYRCGHTVGIALGMTDLSATALSRMDWAAQRAGVRGPGLRAAREYLRVTAYLRARDYDTCQRLNASGAALLEGAEPADPGVLVARGQLHLGAAVIAARMRDREAMKGNLEEAAKYAALTGEDASTFWFGFGPTNVAVHRVMTLVELGEYGAAVAASRGMVFPPAWLPTRIGHHHFDLARAYRWMNRPDSALAELRRARRAAPEQARRHPLVRETVEALVRAENRKTVGLAEYAEWIGV
jgi:XRE family transcriptional regulator, fatty acid utilization regulator